MRRGTYVRVWPQVHSYSYVCSMYIDTYMRIWLRVHIAVHLYPCTKRGGVLSGHPSFYRFLLNAAYGVLWISVHRFNPHLYSHGIRIPDMSKPGQQTGLGFFPDYLWSLTIFSGFLCSHIQLAAGTELATALLNLLSEINLWMAGPSPQWLVVAHRLLARLDTYCTTGKVSSLTQEGHSELTAARTRANHVTSAAQASQAKSQQPARNNRNRNNRGRGGGGGRGQFYGGKRPGSGPSGDGDDNSSSKRPAGNANGK